MTQEQAAPTQVQIPGDSQINIQLPLVKVQQLVLVLQKQPFEAVSGFLPEILMQANSQVASIMINAKTEQQEAKE
ncbi:MAG TPA: hypothetical protein VLA31_08700 [Burkholderiaceae bacterium]|jgi:hypothetical protein|nr:hypothetical protein [Burkholderiaceae bacterium]